MSQRPTCRVVRAEPDYVGKQGLTYAPAISAESVGAAGSTCSSSRCRRAPARRRTATSRTRRRSTFSPAWPACGTGDDLSEHMWTRSGDFVYIPANVPHLPYNASRTGTCTAVIARTDPNEQESVVLMPELDALRPPGADPMADE